MTHLIRFDRERSARVTTLSRVSERGETKLGWTSSGEGRTTERMGRRSGGNDGSDGTASARATEPPSSPRTRGPIRVPSEWRLHRKQTRSRSIN